MGCVVWALTAVLLVLKELRKEKGGRSSSMVANLIVHAGDTASMALYPSQSAAVSGGLKLRDGPADNAAAWKTSPESNNKRQSRSQQPSQVRSASADHVIAPLEAETAWSNMQTSCFGQFKLCAPMTAAMLVCSHAVVASECPDCFSQR